MLMFQISYSTIVLYLILMCSVYGFYRGSLSLLNNVDFKISRLDIISIIVLLLSFLFLCFK